MANIIPPNIDSMPPEQAIKHIPQLTKDFMEYATSILDYPTHSNMQTWIRERDLRQITIDNIRQRYTFHLLEKFENSSNQLQTYTNELVTHARRLNRLTLVIIGGTIGLAIITTIDLTARLLLHI
jgi:hypothetical protein